MRRRIQAGEDKEHWEFQSQMRSRSTCDSGRGMLSGRALYLFQSQMRSRSTCDNDDGLAAWKWLAVSISDEKPLHMRPGYGTCRPGSLCVSISDEKPLHMRLPYQSSSGLSLIFVSISDEKPLHMRRGQILMMSSSIRCFNLR